MPKETGGYTVAMRKTYDKDFKAKIALEALRGDKTIQELGQIYQVHPNLINPNASAVRKKAPTL